jgi:hypothetical protein
MKLRERVIALCSKDNNTTTGTEDFQWWMQSRFM